MVFGHLTVTAALHRETRRQWPSFPVALGALLFGAYLPDMVDKPISMLTGLSGHAYGHSLAMQALLFGLLLLVLQSHRGWLAAVAAGAALHLAEDAVTLKELWAPFTGPIPDSSPYDLLGNFAHFYSTFSPLLCLELMALLYWLVVGMKAARERYGRRSPLAGVSAPLRKTSTDVAS